MGGVDLGLLDEELTLADLDRLTDELDDAELVVDPGTELGDHDEEGSS